MLDGLIKKMQARKVEHSFFNDALFGVVACIFVEQSNVLFVFYVYIVLLEFMQYQT